LWRNAFCISSQEVVSNIGLFLVCLKGDVVSEEAATGAAIYTVTSLKKKTTRLGCEKI
jgi:hypothetical protein